jgi:tripartite-type tricarboxylate transporter receptor subunit TctC
VKVLAVADKKRSPAMPDVPTAAEAGLPGLVAVGWFAMAGPPGLKPAIAEQISAGVDAALKMPDVQQRLRAVAVDPMGGTPADMAAFIKDEKVRWGDVIKQNHIVLE